MPDNRLSDEEERAVQLMVGRIVGKSADTAKKLRDFARDMQRMADVFDERVATKRQPLSVSLTSWVMTSGSQQRSTTTLSAGILLIAISFARDFGAPCPKQERI